MRIVLFANNWVGWQVLETLLACDDTVAGLVVHQEGDRKFVDEMLRIVPEGTRVIAAGPGVRGERVRHEIASLEPDFGISAFYGYLFPSELIRLFPRGMINVHPSILPFNRGIYANVWSIVDRTPAGATLHWIDPGVDSGDIIAQREVPLEPVDTGLTLYEKLRVACADVFRDSWELVRRGEAPRHPQDTSRATLHQKKDVSSIDHIDLDRTYRARDLIDILRARTFPPHHGAYFLDDQGRKVYLSLSLSRED